MFPTQFGGLADVKNTSQSLSCEESAFLNQRETQNYLAFRNQLQLFPLGASYSPSPLFSWWPWSRFDGMSVSPGHVSSVVCTMLEKLLEFIKSCNDQDPSEISKSVNILIQLCFCFIYRKKQCYKIVSVHSLIHSFIKSLNKMNLKQKKAPWHWLSLMELGNVSRV